MYVRAFGTSSGCGGVSFVLVFEKKRVYMKGACEIPAVERMVLGCVVGARLLGLVLLQRWASTPRV
jgi:hypothetical protein